MGVEVVKRRRNARKRNNAQLTLIQYNLSNGSKQADCETQFLE